jgi:cell division septation protein DedD
MTQAWQHRAARWMAVAAVCVGSCAIAITPADSQQATKAKPAAKAGATKAPGGDASGSGKADLVTAQRYVESGITSLETGHLDASIASLTSALAAGSLPPAQTARALHYRGVAYRKQGKPAQALSDLTSALSIRNGLTDSQRSEALKERAAAYRDAGLPDQSEADSVRATAKNASGAAASTSVATAATARDDSAPAAPASSGGSFFASWFGGGQKEAAAEPAPAADGAPANRASIASWSSNTDVRPAAPAPEPKAKAEIRTAAVSRPAPAAKSKAPTAAGSYRIQIAVVRSREEAEEIAAKVQKKYARNLTGREATIDEVVMGNMGKLYRLRIGPYVNASETNTICANLKRDGYYCMAPAQ